MDEVFATVSASQARRWTGVGMLMIVGAVVIYVAMATPPAFEWQVFLIGTGLGAFWMADRMRRATEHKLELTETELKSTEGIVLARIEDIKTVERGVFAFKPSNGFLITLKTRGNRVWRPGLWWRMGRRIGIGGVTPASQTKFMSEMLAAQLMQRDQESDHTT
ncbi:hypothetical protein [Falsiphaeobacter marinintestinus]|uniref:hypothetical protein n=1 Tax=Falsiphaeobacter marinintestinus TaxID=1492905 RepID=UPI001FEBDF8F|nr:hypothetical protein [Phaeobacter marinintestinus]